jgi:two-component system, cell cycle sensor histidine kinase and response regulator CckA
MSDDTMLDDTMLLRALVEQTRDHAIFLIGPDGHNLTWGVGVERLLGYGKSEFVGRHTRDIFTEEDRAAGVPERELAFAAAHGEASDERWLERKNGTRFWASGLTSRVLDDEGRLTGFAKIFRDLTVEREFEQDLRSSAERYRMATRAAHEALWDRDLNTDTVTWTDGVDYVFGYDADEVGRDIAWWEERIHPEDRGRVRDSLGRAVGTGHQRWEEEYRFRRGDGEYVLVHDRALIMRSTDGVPLRMLGAMADVTQQQRSRDVLRQSQRLEALGRLAGGVAHDLNNMLMAIIGYTEMLDRDLLPGDGGHRLTAEVLASANRSAALTRQLLAFARRETTRPVQLDLNALVTRIATALPPLIGPEVELRLALAERLGPVHADPSQLEQILVDLALNARDAMPEGGRLTIETREQRLDEAAIRTRHPGIGIPPGLYVTVVMSDSGIGMSPDVLDRTFEPFFTTKAFGKGTGLGLAAAYGAVKQNNGYIWARSDGPGRGSSFEILLPRSDAEGGGAGGVPD